MEEASAIERALLSGFLRDRFLLGKALEAGFRPELMPHSLGRTVAKVLLDLNEQPDIPLDPLAVRALLNERGAGSPEMRRFLDQVLATPEPDAATVIAYVDLLKARHSRLRLVEINTAITTYLEEERTDGQDIVDFVGGLIPPLMEIQQQRLARSTLPASEIGKQLVEEIVGGGAGRTLGYNVAPFERLNEAISGLRRGFYYGLAGAPRRGKTNFALELAHAVAARYQIPVLYFSWEQTSRVLFSRLLAREALVNPAILLTADGTAPRIQERVKESWEKMKGGLGTLFLIESGRNDTVERVKARAHNLMHLFHTDECAIFIDYLQRMPLEEPVHDEKARTDLISGKLADLSLELNCPVFAISPLDKEGCRLDEKPAEDVSEFARPTMHHSVGSGDLEYDLDVAMVFSKDWVATKNLHDILVTEARAGRTGSEVVPRVDIIDLHLDKNRDAPDSVASTIQYAFFVTLNKFVEIGYKTEDQFTAGFRDFAKMQQILEQLREEGLLTPV
ncbi:MAG: DnaB-like helicase C-terminal domain-containing protein [Armatimonadota bacterium]|nr:DnaB-like helicase C-terminal domain-containing protein [Armatimonadota bacterium]MDR7452177.1 DnaB-like helicase C-terminal domain-containing protein [Armatimonadota bacterium]MDR7468056.1 DnaB-like helicase C-terminal domain-containing protein [Armatimonadota bacterium]MDR7494903.1 DnaB-like helicase C-terminal domain-containing protein [Armatimonadota bacterium]MDR7500300.1 DnaB-like helicase C-terminal domain-containing protein [Armatimonadota bacterium]